VEVCPAQAVVLRELRLRFDYDRCIRCYCCQEVCPARAIGFHSGPLVRLLTRLGR
jgi:Fe-S-cluster-containing hydrogenase component 2